MIDTVVCAAPAGIDGSGRVRVPVLPWATGGAMTTGTGVCGTDLPSVVLIGAVAAQQPVACESFATTTPYSTLGNHSPGRPQS